MPRIIMLYAILSYCLFLGIAVWMAMFLQDVADLRSSGPESPWPMAVAIDIALITIFGLAHSIMARPAFKQVWTRIIPPASERATYVLQSSALLALIFVCWRPIPVTIWDINGVLAAVMLAVFSLGLGLIVLATFLLGHFEFTGLRQAWNGLSRTTESGSKFRTPLLYRIVRHPLQLGLILSFFAVPHMTADGLLFATVMLVYILIGLRFEERALLREFGPDYAAYRRAVPMLVPRLPFLPKRRPAPGEITSR
ncbi:isoprenylcysteine carboxylmethyltransferase family protein [Aliiroseovarius sp. S1339]|uniref:methyltransferase family protein n=1 Tax=Aliiroseovarius sp. S1339 TaxID=2936990 RepID=UPI0020BE7B8C|nr:isoprenylcysteine carboxylmethyltransferase family protein [Aliiroseovarius sp. S1339]MCK8462929.1 isoprenylcysteine carboxylmethyltransferase family protein [Aliiroseovarius sp. S1339]